MNFDKDLSMPPAILRVIIIVGVTTVLMVTNQSFILVSSRIPISIYIPPPPDLGAITGLKIEVDPSAELKRTQINLESAKATADIIGNFIINREAGISSNLLANVFPAIMKDTHDKIWVLWGTYWKNFRGLDISYKTSTDGGRTWSAPTKLITGLINTERIATLVDSGSTMWVTWASASSYGGGDSNVFYIKSTDGGITWSTPQSPYAGTAPWNGYSMPAIVEAFGQIYIFFININGIYYVASADNGATWSSPQRILTGDISKGAYALSVIYDGKNIYLVYAKGIASNFDLDIFLKKSSDGVTWSSEKRVTNLSGQEHFPYIVKDNSGKLYIFFSHSIGAQGIDDDIFYTVSTNAGESWSSPERITFDSKSDYTPTVIFDDGMLRMVWASDRSGNFDILYEALN